MRKKLVLSDAAGAVSRQGGSKLWDVDIRKSEFALECWMADARSGVIAWA
jgi:hypothetical protein